MKKLFTLIVLAFLALGSVAQSLMVEQEGGKLYLNHTVAPKENWYSVGRMYNLSPNAIASFNGLKIDKGLGIGQKLKVPLNDQNFAQGGQSASDEALIPVYHTVQGKEGLYRIGQNFNKATVDQLKAWNKLKSDEVSVGSKLIVGYLRVKKELSPLAGAAVQVPATTVAKTTTPADKPVSKTAEEKPAPVTKPAEDKPVNKPVEEKPAPVTKAPETKPATTTTTPPVTNTTPPPVTSIPSAPGTEGAFAGVYREQSKGTNQVTGVAGIFKSTSGWKDGKYYVLMNKVTPGTIVKITTVGTNRTVYAKVLGEIPPGKENEGLLIRLSNAASAQLQVADSARFDVQLSY